MVDPGKITPPSPAMPSRTTDGVVRRKRPPPEQSPQRDPHKRSRKKPEDDLPHIDEYA